MIATASGLNSCDFIYPSDSLRYRMTVEVETPAGLRRGSSVIESRSQNGPRWGDAPGLSYSVQGEAVTVDLPNGRTLFALLVPRAGSDAAYYQLDLFKEALRHGAKPSTPVDVNLSQGVVWREVRSQARSNSIALELPPEDYPLLVTFADVRDSKSVSLVDPLNLSATFGPGVKLKSIFVTVSKEPVTTGIEKRLGWLSEFPEPRLDPDYKASTNPNLSQRLSHGDFRQSQ